MKEYELALVLKTSLSEADQKKLIDEVKELITKEGKITTETPLGRKSLAYRIGKESSGVFSVMTFSAGASVPQAISRKLRIEEDVLRYLLEQRSPEVVKAAK